MCSSAHGIYGIITDNSSFFHIKIIIFIIFFNKLIDTNHAIFVIFVIYGLIFVTFL